MKIMHLRSSGGFFGAEGVILNLARELERSGTYNLIACIDNAKNSHVELVEEAHKLNLKTASINCRRRLDIGTMRNIRRLIKEHNIGILHCHDYKSDFYGFLAAAFLNVKLITTNHLWTKETGLLRMYEFLDSVLVNFFDKIVAVSDEITSEMVKKPWLNRRKVITIYNGISTDKFYADSPEKAKNRLNLSPSSNIIGFVGRLSSQKGLEFLLETAKHIVKDVPDTNFLIVGKGDLDDKLKHKVIELGLHDKVIFTGEKRDLTDVYSAMDVFVLPSVREGTPLVILEALAMGKPIVATDVGGVSKIMKSSMAGILVKPKDVDGLTKAIMFMLQNKEEASVFSSRGRSFVESRFSAKRMAEQYREVYEHLIYN